MISGTARCTIDDLILLCPCRDAAFQNSAAVEQTHKIQGFYHQMRAQMNKYRNGFMPDALYAPLWIWAELVTLSQWWMHAAASSAIMRCGVLVLARITVSKDSCLGVRNVQRTEQESSAKDGHTTSTNTRVTLGPSFVGQMNNRIILSFLSVWIWSEYDASFVLAWIPLTLSWSWRLEG